MPLLAYTTSGDPLVAPLMTDGAWERLKATKHRDLWMPFGRGEAVPKVSKLGTRFFAHKPGQAPEGGRESEIHLHIKAQCLIGARNAGWEALPEQSGRTPDNQEWRADVLCRRPGKEWTVAFEAQVQPQTEETYRQRQARYTASGVRTLWLVAHDGNVTPDKDLPAFRTTHVRGPEGRPDTRVQVDGLSLSVAEFVAGALQGQLHWYRKGQHGVIKLVFRRDRCWHVRCKQEVMLLYRAETVEGEPVDVVAVQAMTGFEEVYTKIEARFPRISEPPRRGKSHKLTTRCPRCLRDFHYPEGDWGGPGGAYLRKGDDFVTIGPTMTVLIGVEFPQLRDGSLTPHARWHWGDQSRWTEWAAFGGLGLMTVQDGQAAGRSGPRRARF